MVGFLTHVCGFYYHPSFSCFDPSYIGGRPVQTACTPWRLCRLSNPSRPQETKLLGFQSRKVGDGIRPFNLRGISKELVKLGRKGRVFSI
jgi:hypothetical protein